MQDCPDYPVHQPHSATTLQTSNKAPFNNSIISGLGTTRPQSNRRSRLILDATLLTPEKECLAPKHRVTNPYCQGDRFGFGLAKRRFQAIFNAPSSTSALTASSRTRVAPPRPQPPGTGE